MSSSDDWALLTDPATGVPYYFNQKTGESSWTLPEGVVIGPKHGDQVMIYDDNGVQQPSGWLTLLDPGSQTFYFFETATERSEWVLPAEIAALQQPRVVDNSQQLAEQARLAEQERLAEEARQAAEAARVQAQLEAARLKAEQEAKFRAEQEAARLKAEQEAARLKAEQEAARLKAEQEAARLKAEQEAKLKAEQEASRAAYEAAVRQAQEIEADNQRVLAAAQQAHQETVRLVTEQRNAIEAVARQWQEILDAGTGMNYYYCEAEQKTQWEKPDFWGQPLPDLPVFVAPTLRPVPKPTPPASAPAIPPPPVLPVPSLAVDAGAKQRKALPPAPVRTNGPSSPVGVAKSNAFAPAVSSPKVESIPEHMPVTSSAAPSAVSSAAAALNRTLSVGFPEPIHTRSASDPVTAAFDLGASPTLARRATVSTASMTPFLPRPSLRAASIDDSLMTRPTALKVEVQDEIKKFQLRGFAAEHFCTFRTGRIFKTEIPVEEVLTFSTEPLQKCLLKTSKPEKESAIALFQLVQSFMGDDVGPKKAPLMVLTQIRELCSKKPVLRDECFAQICKQCTKNPSPANTLAGWKLLILCASTFSASRGFQSHLLEFVRESYQGPPEYATSIPILSKFQLERSMETPLDKLIPLTISQLDSVLARGVHPMMFSFFYSVAQLLEVQKQLNISNGMYPDLPVILPVLTQLVRDLGGFQQQGIFRLAAEKKHLEQARTAIECGDDITSTDPNVPADLMKQFFRKLSDPIIPFENFEECLQLHDHADEALALVKRVCSPAHLTVLDFLFKFLNDLAQYAPQTSMSAENLALVFAPGLLRSKQDDDPQAMLNYSHKQKLFIKNVMSVWHK